MSRSCPSKPLKCCDSRDLTLQILMSDGVGLSDLPLTHIPVTPLPKPNAGSYRLVSMPTRPSSGQVNYKLSQPTLLTVSNFEQNYFCSGERVRACQLTSVQASCLRAEHLQTTSRI